MALDAPQRRDPALQAEREAAAEHLANMLLAFEATVKMAALLIGVHDLAAFLTVREKTMARTGGLDRSPLHLLHRAGQCAADIFDAEVANVTPRQLAVLTAVASDEGASQTKLGEVTCIDRSTLADIVKRLQGKGRLQRVRSRGDARAWAVKLTDEGRRLLNSASPVARRVDDRVLSALPEKQREAFLSALASVVERLQSLPRSR